MKNRAIPVTVKEYAAIKRTDVPVRIGVPFPTGWLKDSSRLCIRDSSGIYHMLQVQPLSRWKDKSIQWALLNFLASAEPNSEATWFIEKADSRHINTTDSESSQLQIKKEDSDYKIDTGATTFYLSSGPCFPFQSVIVNDKEILSSQGSKLILVGENGRSYHTVIQQLKIEEEGPVVVSLSAHGFFGDQGIAPIARFEARLQFYRGLSAVTFDIQIHNPRAALHPGGIWDLGDPGSIFFQEMSLVLYRAEKSSSVIWQVNPNSKPDHADTEFLSLYQDSSGGENWNSPNHIDKDGNLTVSFRGYKIFTSRNQEPKEFGLRATPIVQMRMPSAWMAVSVKDFWQNFPKSLTISENQLKIGIFPAESPGLYELQGGEKKRHTLLLDFGEATNSTCFIPHFLEPLQISISPEWIIKSRTISHFVPEKDDSNTLYLEYINNVIEGENSFFAKREIIDEYGWRNFGDVFADHEAVHTEDKSTFISHYNNQFDVVYGAGIHFLRSCDRRWYELMSQYARHVMDIDIYHTDEDKSAYNHGQFWHTDHYRPAGRATHRTYSGDNLDKDLKKSYGGGPSNENNYTSGLLLYH